MKLLIHRLLALRIAAKMEAYGTVSLGKNRLLMTKSTRRHFFIGAALGLMSAPLMAGTPPTPTKADVPYGDDPHRIMDIYVPPEGAGSFPVLLFFGGIWKSSKGVPNLNRFSLFVSARILPHSC